MDFLVSDFNGAREYYEGRGSAEWLDIESLLRAMPLYFHPSDQKGIKGRPIFDPKGTNAHLMREAQGLGWKKVPVPEGLRVFGNDWDGGKGASLAEWQFSNYPFLWNNVIRSEAVYNRKVSLPSLKPLEALIVVTKCGVFPASNSTLYYEQAHAQLEAATSFDAFAVPIRLVGLSIPSGADRVEVMWSEYGARYRRAAQSSTPRSMKVTWLRRGKFNSPRASFKLV